MQNSKLSRTENTTVTVLRVVLGIIFVWLGLLQLAGLDPLLSSSGMSQVSFVIEEGFVIGGVEVVIGILFLIDRFHHVAEVLLFIYLLVVVGRSVIGISKMFASQFFHLTVFGELMIKNITLGIAGILVMIHERKLRG